MTSAIPHLWFCSSLKWQKIVPTDQSAGTKYLVLTGGVRKKA